MGKNELLRLSNYAKGQSGVVILIRSYVACFAVSFLCFASDKGSDGEAKSGGGREMNR